MAHAVYAWAVCNFFYLRYISHDLCEKKWYISATLRFCNNFALWALQGKLKVAPDTD